MKTAMRDVLPRYLHGAELAAGRLNAQRQGGPRKKTSRARKRVVYPPAGGWR